MKLNLKGFEMAKAVRSKASEAIQTIATITVTAKGEFKLKNLMYWKKVKGKKLVELRDAPAKLSKALNAKLG